MLSFQNPLAIKRILSSSCSVTKIRIQWRSSWISSQANLHASKKSLNIYSNQLIRTLFSNSIPLSLRAKKFRHGATLLKYKYDRKLILSGAEFSSIEEYAAIMMYDKCGLLQMLLYQDGHEEIRKPARKIVSERKIKPLIELLMPWVPQLYTSSFTENGLIDPKTMRTMCDAVAAVANNLEMPEIKAECVGPQKIYKSLTRLMMDLGEATVRCESVETHLATSLFLFLTAEEIYSHLKESDQTALRSIVAAFLKNYVASLLLVESIDSQTHSLKLAKLAKVTA